jgi:GTP-binding protein
MFVVTGDKIERFARRLDLTDYYAQLRIKDIMHKMGIMQELHRKGATESSVVQIGKQQFPLQ